MTRSWNAAPSVAWQVLRAEGGAAFRDRLIDRLGSWRRRRRFPTIAVDSPVPASAEAAETLARVPVLTVLSTPPRPELGGVQIQLLRRLTAQAAHGPWALLYPEASGYRLEVATGAKRFAVVFTVSPPSVEALEDLSFEWVVRRAAERIGAGIVHFEQIAGCPLGSLSKLPSFGLRLVLSVHDFGLFCLRPHLLERPMMRFCDYSRDAGRCALCLQQDWPVSDDFQGVRRDCAGELLRSAEAVVFPSDFLRRTYQELIPGLDASRLQVVAPASADKTFETHDSDSKESQGRRGAVPRHIAVVGSVKALKGTLLLEELVRRFPSDRYPRLRWSVYGGGDPAILRRLKRLPAVRIRGYYRAGQLPRLLAADQVDLALLLSITPESYSLSCDECLRAGVPILAFDHGAIADRLRRLGGGMLADLGGSIDGLAERLLDILEVGAPFASPPLELPDGDSSASAMQAIYDQIARAGIAGLPKP